MKLRLPLQTGSQAIFGAAVGSVLLALAVPLLIPVPFVMGAFWLLLVSALFAFVGGSFLADAWRARPSDVELDAEGLRILGGPRDGLTLAWARVGSCKLEPKPEYGTGLILVVGKDELLIATTMDDDEEASLDAVRRTLDALRDPTPAPPQEPAAETRILACPKCGGITAPSAAPRVACGFCAATIDMPAAIREKVSASARLTKSRTSIERYASRFVQSTLSRARAAMVPTYLAVAAWLVAIVVGISMYVHGTSSAWGILFLVVALGFLAPGVTALFGGVLIGRQAAPILALHLGARPPARPGEPHACRCCGGPLPEPAAGVVTRCIFCDADNVLGMSIGREAASAELQAGLLEATVSRTRRARSKWQRVGLGVGASCLVASTIALLGIRTQVRAEGGARDLRRITWDPFDDARDPFPSPDGSLILYRIKERGEDGPADVDGLVSAWGGAGRYAKREQLDVFSLDQRDAAATVLPADGCAKRQATPSPDGRRFAYVAACDGHERLYVMDVATGTSRALTSGAAAVDHPRWGGDFLYFGAGGSIYRLRPPG